MCTRRVMEYAAASGRYEVHALCMRYGKEPAEETVRGVHVHRFRPSLWTRMRNHFADTRSWPRLDRVCELLQKTLTIPFYPVLRPLTTSRFYRKARRLQGALGFGIVVSEHHELDTLLTGCRLMRDFDGLKHVALLWDPVKGQIPTVHLPAAFTDRRIGRVEALLSEYATLQVSMASMKDYFLANGDISSDRRAYLDIPGILEPGPELPTKHLSLLRKDCINIVFSGLLSPLQRDPVPIIDLLARCDCAERINLVFFSMGADNALRQAARSFPGTICCHDYIPLEELHSVYRHADFLLNVSHINANMVPSKIFEYISFGKPVISTFVTDGDSAQKYLSRYSEGLCIDLKASREGNVSALNSFLSSEHRLVPFEEVAAEFRENSPESYLAVLDGLAG